VESLPGSPFRPVSSTANSLIQQLAHSSDGHVHLPPGDYAIPIRIVCTGVHAAKTQHGIVYRIAPLQGKRAPIIIALLSRAPAAHVPFMPLQQLVWQLEGGLSYDELPPQSKQLIDELVPEDRNLLGADFVQTLQKFQKATSLLSRFPGLQGANAGIQELEAMIQRYQGLRQTLLNYANNFDALSQQLVNIVPGTADNAGPAAWSQLNSRAYARMTGGRYYGEVGTLQLRVLPGPPTALSCSSNRRLVRASYIRSGGVAQISATDSDAADVPFQEIGYPNESTMQGLTWMIANDPGLLLALETTSNDLQGVRNAAMNLMWIDCLAYSPEDVPAYVLYNTPAGPAVGEATEVNDIVGAAIDFLGDPSNWNLVNLAAQPVVAYAFNYMQQRWGISCSNYNLVSVLSKTLQSSNVTNAQTSHSIIQNSISSSGNTIFMQVAAISNLTKPVAGVELSVTPCAEMSTCQSTRLTSTTGNLQNSGNSTSASALAGPAITLGMLPLHLAAGASCTISGAVHTAEGKPMASTTVQIAISAAGVSFPPVTLTTDKDGNYSTSFTAPSVSGTATITATVAGSSPTATATTTLNIGANAP
jgi:hypothetical protein